MNAYSPIEPITEWLVQDRTIKLPVIAGPCSAENREQMLAVAEGLSKNPNVVAFRCGLWKPRTRPGGFEGVGEKGLPWIKEIKEKFGLKICVEVATPQHAEKCLKAGVDFFWIGARTTGNPFSVAELCESVKGANIPMLIKNPMNPDLKLWIGTIERFYNAGCSRLVGVHRGFSLFNNDIYRNDPCWQTPIEMMRTFPSLPLFCDPSHITGKKELLQEVSQKALDLNFAGLMIEVHPNPEIALTDKEQQITPEELYSLLSKLVIREDKSISPNRELSMLRQDVDSLDKELLCILFRRMEIIKRMAKIKKNNNLSILQMDRWEEILKNTSGITNSLGMDFNFIKTLMEQIHNESIHIQNIIINQEDYVNKEQKS